MAQKTAKYLKLFLKLADRGSACTPTASESPERYQQLCNHELLLSTFCLGLSFFLLCIVRCFALLRYEPHLCVLLSRSVSLHPNILNASSGFVLGCWACTKLLR